MFAEKFGNRIPATVEREEIMTYLFGMQKSGRTVINQKRAICNFFNWLVEKRVLTTNPAGGIKKRQLPKEAIKEIEYLSLDQVEIRDCGFAEATPSYACEHGPAH